MKKIYYAMKWSKLLVPSLMLLSAISFAQPSANINDYVLFAQKSLGFKGRDCANCPQNGVISGGSVGVADCAPVNGINLTFGGPVTMPDNGTYVVGDRVRIDNSTNDPTSIDKLYVNDIAGAFDPTVLRTPPPLPWGPCPLLLLSSVPFPLIPFGAVDKTVPDGGSLVLGPGDYQDLWVHDNGTLTLSAGIYNFRNIKTGKHVHIITVDGIEIRSAQGLNLGNDAFVGPANNVKFFVRSDGLDPNNDVSVNFGKQSEFHGSVFAPKGHMNLGHNTDLFGKFWANTISSDFNVSIQNPLSCLPTTADDGRCDPGVVNLMAFGCSNCSALKWYNDQFAGIQVASGGSYSPNLSVTTDFWVTCTGPGGESSPRVKVTGTIFNPNIVINKAITPPICGITPCTGAINITVSGGATPYTFAWTKLGDPAFTPTSEDLTGICPGTYTVVVTDDNGCTATDTYGISCEPNICNQNTSAPSTDIFSYALFAFDELIFKGGNQSAGWGKIAGDIGVNFAGLSPTGWSLSFATSGYAIIADGYKAVADNTRADATGSFYDLFTNTKNPSFAAFIRHSWVHPVSFPIIPSAPALPFTPCRLSTNSASDLTIAQNVTYHFLAGTYRNVRFNDGDIINMDAGTYDIRDLSIGKKVTINVAEGTILQIDYSFNSNDGLKFGLGSAAGAHIYVGACGINVSTTRSGTFGHGSEVHAHYYSPTGWLDIGGGNNLFGNFVAERITGDPNNNVYNTCPNLPIFPKTNRISPPETAGTPFGVTVYDNPSRTSFRLEVQSGSDDPITIQMMDISGRVVGKINTTRNIPVVVGESFLAGVYYAEVVQGKDKKIVKLVKLN